MQIKEITKRVRYSGKSLFHDRAAEYSSICKMLNLCIEKINEVVRVVNSMDARITRLEKLRKNGEE